MREIERQHGYGLSSSALLFLLHSFASTTARSQGFCAAWFALEHAEIAKMIASSSAKVSEQVKSRLSAKGFSTANINRLQKCAQLCGITVQAKLRSKILWLRLNQTQSQVAKAIATESLKQNRAVAFGNRAG